MRNRRSPKGACGAGSVSASNKAKGWAKTTMQVEHAAHGARGARDPYIVIFSRSLPLALLMQCFCPRWMVRNNNSATACTACISCSPCTSRLAGTGP